jgi:hypothetical protein
MAKIVSMQKKDSNILSGLPLTSFLQILEQDQQTCSLIVSVEDKSGILFVKDGELIDAVVGRSRMRGRKNNLKNQIIGV